MFLNNKRTNLVRKLQHIRQSSKISFSALSISSGKFSWTPQNEGFEETIVQVVKLNFQQEPGQKKKKVKLKSIISLKH